MKKAFGYIFYILGGFMALGTVSVLLPILTNFTDIINEGAASEPDAEQLGRVYGKIFSIFFFGGITYLFFKFGRKWTKNKNDDEQNLREDMFNYKD